MSVCVWKGRGGGAEIKQAELNGLLADKMKESDNEDWAEARENGFLPFGVREGEVGGGVGGAVKETRKRGMSNDEMEGKEGKTDRAGKKR